MRFFLRFFVVPFHNFVFRLTRGRALGQFDLPVLLLTTTGRRSGKQRTIPLLYLEEDSTLLVVASMAGAPSNPGWYHNLVANLRGCHRPGASPPVAGVGRFLTVGR